MGKFSNQFDERKQITGGIGSAAAAALFSNNLQTNV
jgi:hypothetical protein